MLPRILRDVTDGVMVLDGQGTVLSILTTVRQRTITQQSMEQSAKESGLSYALISGVQKVKLAGAEKRAFAKWSEQYAKWAHLQYDPPLFLKLNGVISLAISLAWTLVMYAVAVRSGVSVAEYYAFNSAYAMIAGAFASLAGVAAMVGQIVPILNMARPILEASPEISADKQVVERLAGGVELNNASFRYTEDMPNVLDDVSLKIRPGQYVAIVGRTGCGKSTLMRLLIARAIAPKPRILLFDEATSALDNITQRVVSESLDALKCTRIVIAHRLSTIRRCDRIVVLDGGHIVEDGTYDELIAGGGFFAQLVARQRLDAPAAAEM